MGWGRHFLDLAPIALRSRCFAFAQAFRNIDMLYLTVYYLNITVMIVAFILGVMVSQFSFILPLIFYNKYIDASSWEYRFRVMTVEIMTCPLMLCSNFVLFRCTILGALSSSGAPY